MEKIAVIKTGGKQYLVQEGDVLSIERLKVRLEIKSLLKTFYCL